MNQIRLMDVKKMIGLQIHWQFINDEQMLILIVASLISNKTANGKIHSCDSRRRQHLLSGPFLPKFYCRIFCLIFL